MFKMKNKIQNYKWGSKTLLPELLKENFESSEPIAEVWLGAHPKASSEIDYEDNRILLLDYIKNNPEKSIGEDSIKKFGVQLPFLMKILTAETPLSIQVHPDKQQAEKGFESEEMKDLPIDAFNRCYKDDNHKPELILALTDFDMLCGFRPLMEIKDLLNYLDLNQFLPVKHQITQSSEKLEFIDFFSELMKLSKDKHDYIVTNLLKKISSNNPRDSKDEFLFEWITKLSKYYPGDIGVLMPILLNIKRLKPGEAVYLEAGVMHAYLKGAGIEIMANSDNVLRCGLTPKYMDVNELLSILKYEFKTISLAKSVEVKNELVFKTNAQEFELSNIMLDNEELSLKSCSSEVLLLLSGRMEVCSNLSETLLLNNASSVFIPYYIKNYSLKGSGVIFRAKIPGISIIK